MVLTAVFSSTRIWEERDQMTGEGEHTMNEQHSGAQGEKSALCLNLANPYSLG